MAIIKEAWVVKCDKCGGLLCVNDGVDWSAFVTYDDAKEAVEDDPYWDIDTANGVLCEDCVKDTE
jgi:hypothetical protein